MKARTMLLVLVVLLFGTGAAWAQGFRGSMGSARSWGSWGPTVAPRADWRQSGQIPQISGSGPQVIIRSGVPFRAGIPVTVVAPSRFVSRVAPVVVFSPPIFFPHSHFLRHRGILIVDVPTFPDVTVTTSQYAPTGGWIPPHWTDGQPADSRLRAPGQLAPFDPTPQEIVERMLALAGVKKDDLVYDLGSGDGRVAITAAKKYGAKAVGFEIDPGLVKLARENIRHQGAEKLVEIRQQDFMTADLSPATVVTLYLSYDGNLALRPRLMNQLKAGARVVSNTFDMGDWQPKIAESYRDAAGDTHLLYYWEISAPELYGENSREKTSPWNQSGASQRLSFVATE
jgi:precorrin-6B methylase 2